MATHKRVPQERLTPFHQVSGDDRIVWWYQDRYGNWHRGDLQPPYPDNAIDEIFGLPDAARTRRSHERRDNADSGAVVEKPEL